jgi:hypothetical protein
MSLRYFNAAGADESGGIGEPHNPETHLIPSALESALGLRPELLNTVSTSRSGEVASIDSRPKYKIEARSLGKCQEIAVAGEEKNAAVEAALGDQRIAQARFVALCQHLRAQNSCPLPIATFDFDQRYF